MIQVTKGDHEDAYRQLPMSARDGRAAVATLRDPRGEELYGFAPKTQLLGSAAAVLRYNCFSRIMASLACRVLELPCVGYRDNFVAIPQLDLVSVP